MTLQNKFYKAFEDEFRGSRETIKARLDIYSPYIKPVISASKSKAILDIGCGRGELLENLRDEGYQARGIDIDEHMLGPCKDLGLDVKLNDAIKELTALPDNALAVISALHVVEHVSFDELMTIIEHAYRVLEPGGLLILETPNPENIIVGTSNFYLDPTHIKPIPHRLLSFLATYHGFNKVRVARLNEHKKISKDSPVDLYSVIKGVSPDYAVIALKDELNDERSQEQLNHCFEQKQGVSLAELAEQFQTQLEGMTETKLIKLTEQYQTQLKDIIETKLEKLTEQYQAQLDNMTENKLTKLTKLTEEYETQLENMKKAEEAKPSLSRCCEKVINCRIWHYATLPLRRINDGLKWFMRRVYAWLTFKPGSRPRRIARHMVIYTRNYIAARPRLKHASLRLLDYFPNVTKKLFIHLNRINNNVAPATVAKDKPKQSIFPFADFNLEKKFVLMKRQDYLPSNDSVRQKLAERCGLEIDVDALEAIRSGQPIKLKKSISAKDQQQLIRFVTHVYLALLRRYPGEVDANKLCKQMIAKQDLMIAVEFVSNSHEFKAKGYKRIAQ